jgi:tetratricopeptide (TPR) repeat protein
MRLYLLLSLLGLLVFTGCGPVKPENLSPDEKRVIYHSVQDEIEQLTAEGDTLYASGYYQAAAEAYELVNFYEDRAVIPTDRIRKIRIRANANGKHYYKRALKYLKKDKKRALHEFNKMMRNDPEYKDGKARFEMLKNDPRIRTFLAKMENDLQKALEKNKGAAKDLKRINTALARLVKYDDSNNVAMKAKGIIKAQRRALLNEAVRLYHKGALGKASAKFRLVQSIYKKDRTAEKYLDKIRLKNRLADILNRANKALAEAAYAQAIEAAEAALDIDANSKEAKRILTAARKGYEKQIPDLINQGITYYGKQDFEKALKAFQAVLIMDPDDNTSLTYIRKIERQLETIKSLK